MFAVSRSSKQYIAVHNQCPTRVQTMTSVGGRNSLLASCEVKRLQGRPATHQGMFKPQQAVGRSWRV